MSTADVYHISDTGEWVPSILLVTLLTTHVSTTINHFKHNNVKADLITSWNSLRMGNIKLIWSYVRMIVSIILIIGPGPSKFQSTYSKLNWLKSSSK